MTWQPIVGTDRLKNLPVVLAGPILRKVTRTEVNVWFATKSACTVTLEILDSDFSGSQEAARVGENLYIVVVTARPSKTSSVLRADKVYTYNVSFILGDLESLTLHQAIHGASIGYGDNNLPTFCLPPNSLSDYRLFHGSCRKPHGMGSDALAMLDDLIRTDFSNPTNRPHQLLLTGDQIYADDVAHSLSTMLIDASCALMGWREKIEIKFNKQKSTIGIDELSPPLRSRIACDFGFTSSEADCHLFGLGEFLLMYIFAWSDVLWPSVLPDYGDILKNIDGGMAGITFFPEYEDLEKFAAPVIRQNKVLIDFRDSLTKARRVLANIPSAMIFDDHEITDDWNMERKFCQRVYGNPGGRRVIQNGLIAYALCQHWGNDPSQFGDGESGSFGRALLNILKEIESAVQYDSKSYALASLVGVPMEWSSKTSWWGLVRGKNCLEYSYVIENELCHFVVLDCRTWRYFPKSGTPEIILADKLREQLLRASSTSRGVLFVVSSVNLPPFPGTVRAADNPKISRFVSTHFENDSHPDLYDSWDMKGQSFGRFINCTSERLKALPPSDFSNFLICLSGDVHHSFCSRVAFSGARNLPGCSPRPLAEPLIIAQFVSSSMKNQTSTTVDLQRIGFRYIPKPWISELVLDGGQDDYKSKNRFVGWNGAELNESVAVGLNPSQRTQEGESIPFYIRAGNSYNRLELPSDLHVEPDWEMRLDYISAAKVNESPENKEIIGVNNICEIRISRGAAQTRLIATQTVYADKGGLPIAILTSVCELS